MLTYYFHIWWNMQTKNLGKVNPRIKEQNSPPWTQCVRKKETALNASPWTGQQFNSLQIENAGTSQEIQRFSIWDREFQWNHSDFSLKVRELLEWRKMLLKFIRKIWWGSYDILDIFFFFFSLNPFKIQFLFMWCLKGELDAGTLSL